MSNSYIRIEPIANPLRTTTSSLSSYCLSSLKPVSQLRFWILDPLASSVDGYQSCFHCPWLSYWEKRWVDW